MSKAIIVADLKYKSPRRRGRGTGHKGLRSTLKYVQYREDHNMKASAEKLRDRWQDRGLGAHYRDIFATCDRLKSKHVLAWTWVISPAPDLMALVPEDKRRALVMDVTERVVEAYYEARDFQTPPYSYVLHDRLISDGEQQLHTHVILPGMAPTVEGWEPLYINQRDQHDALFNDVARREFERALDRAIGRDWRRRREAPEIAEDMPHASDDLAVWFPR